MMDSSCFMGTKGESSSPRESSQARRSEAVGQRLHFYRLHVPQGVQAEAAHLPLNSGGDGKQVHRLGGEETGHVRRDPGGPQGTAAPGRGVGGKLGVTHADAGHQVLGNGVQQGVRQPGLAPVQGFQPVRRT